MNDQMTKLIRYEAILDLISKTGCSTTSGGQVINCGACLASAELGREYQCKGGVVEEEEVEKKPTCYDCGAELTTDIEISRACCTHCHFKECGE